MADFLDQSYGSLRKYDLSSSMTSSLNPSLNKKCTSMVELSNLGLLHELNNELEALSDSGSFSSNTEEKEVDDDDFFFFDEDDDNQNVEANSNAMFESSSNETKKQTSFLPMPSGGGGMRRTLSMSNVQRDIHNERVSSAMNRTLGMLCEENASDFSEDFTFQPSKFEPVSDSPHPKPIKGPKKSALKNSSDNVYVDKTLLNYPTKETKFNKMLRHHSIEDFGKLTRNLSPDDFSNSATSSCTTSISESEIQGENPKETKKKTRNISFSTIEVRRYEVTLGDNPSCAEGPPIALDWKYKQSDALDLEEYETQRDPRRDKADLRICHNDRYFHLASQFTSSDLRRATESVKQIRASRRKSISNIRMDPLHEVLEKSGRKFKRLVGRNKKVKSCSIKNHPETIRID